MRLHIVGELLHKSLAEVMALPASEINGWLAYIEMKNKAQEEAAKKAAKSKPSGKPVGRFMGRRH